MEGKMIIWCLPAGVVPLLVKAVWHLNDAIFSAYLRFTGSKQEGKVMSISHQDIWGCLSSERLTFLWNFNFLRRPDDFVNSKKIKYGVGMYRSRIFGPPTIITCSPASNKFVLQSVDDFSAARWQTRDLYGPTSMFNVEGKQHTKVRAFIVNAINNPKALQKIALTVQPRVVSMLRSWADKGTIIASLETKKA